MQLHLWGEVITIATMPTKETSRKVTGYQFSENATACFNKVPLINDTATHGPRPHKEISFSVLKDFIFKQRVNQMWHTLGCEKECL